MAHRVLRYATLLFVLVLCASIRPAAALAPLSYSWWCGSGGYCTFQVTSSNHAKYQWNFGDGTITSVSTSTSASHQFTVSGSSQNFTVTLIGYATVSSGSPDNAIGCSVTAYGNQPGGFPGTTGSCS